MAVEFNDQAYSGKSVGLAPMEGVTDFPFRIWMWLCSSPSEMSTPFLRFTRTWPEEIPKSWAPELLIPNMERALPYRLWPQLMGPDPQRFHQMADLLAAYSPVLEINCGCPAPKVVGRGAGSGVLIDDITFRDYLLRVSDGLKPGTLSVKMRTGFEHTDYFESFLMVLREIPLARLVLHGRTKSQRYRGVADWSLVHAAAEFLSCPVLGSGDISDLSTFKIKMAGSPGASGCLIGRGALRNPWIFEVLRSEQSVELSARILILSLKVFLYLHELFLLRPCALFSLALDGLFTHPARSNVSAWQDILQAVSVVLSSCQFEGEVSLSSLGRLKLLWNYLRSSVPNAWSFKEIFRARSEEQFFTALGQLMDKSDPEEPFQLSWRGEYDWLYQGASDPGKKQ